jgi:hypothetical protein
VNKSRRFVKAVRTAHRVKEPAGPSMDSPGC